MPCLKRREIPSKRQRWPDQSLVMSIVGKETRNEANAVAQQERLANGGKSACLGKVKAAKNRMITQPVKKIVIS